MEQTTFTLRTRHIIKRDDLWQWIKKPSISRIEIYLHANKTLKDDTSVSIYVYEHIEQSQNLLGMFGACAKITRENTPQISESDLGFLHGIQTIKQHCFISKSQVQRIISIQDQNNLKLGIPKQLLKQINFQ